MGREVLAAVCRERDLVPVGVVDFYAKEPVFPLPDGSGMVPYSSDPAAMFARTNASVVVDFTHADWSPRLAREALAAGVRPVIGTSGLPEAVVQELEAECAKLKVGCVLASNFALGAILMQYFARTASRFYSNAEIIEMHHDQKIDAPSGTALATAQMMADARGEPFAQPTTEKQNLAGTRGGELGGVTIHSVRQPGLVAHQEVMFGAPGETLRVRHDSMDRISFMPGVVLSVREVMKLDHLVRGLDSLIGLDA